MNDPIKIKTQFQCPFCNNKSEASIQISFDSAFDDKNVFPTIECANCGSGLRVGVPFIYWRRSTNELFFVFPTERLNNFQDTLKTLRLIYNDFLLSLSFGDQKLLKSSDIKYTETLLFDSMLKGETNGKFSIGLRNMQLTPELTVTVPDEFTYSSAKNDVDLSKNEIAFYETGLSELHKELIDEIESGLNANNIAINLKPIREEQHATSTQGFTEIVLFIAKDVVLPIILSLAANGISKLIEKRKLKKTDKLSVNFKKTKTTVTYHIEGTADDVIRAMNKLSDDTANTVCVPGNCHVVPIMDNIVAEPKFGPTQTIDRAATEYKKHFSGETSVEFTHNNYQTSLLNAKSKELMDDQKYDKAYKVMLPHVNDTSSLELLCNFSLCLKRLGQIEQANEYYRKAISIYLQRPDLNDLEKFVGNYTQEELDTTDAKIRNLL